MTSILLSNSRGARALAAMIAVATVSACAEDQPTAPALNVPSSASAALIGNPKPSCFPKCAAASRILFVKGDKALKIGHIWVMNADTTNQAQLTSGSGDDDYPAWSPDYQKVAFATNRRGAYEIFVVNADGTGLTPLTSTVNGSRDEHASWSPDGSRIYFSRTVVEPGNISHVQIYSVKPNGTGLTQITTDRMGMLFEPTVSPDGKKILVSRLLPGQAWDAAHIYSMNTDGTGLTQVSFGAKGDASPAWSPDGAKIVFVSNFGYPDSRDIAIMNADGTGLQQIVTWPGEQEGPSFARDGAHIVYADFSLNAWGWLMTVKPDGTGMTQLEQTFDLGSYYSPSWSR